MRIANQLRVPLWPVGRGKNLGYGGNAPVLAGSVVLDMSRMKKIEFDEKLGTVILEPGRVSSCAIWLTSWDGYPTWWSGP